LINCIAVSLSANQSTSSMSSEMNNQEVMDMARAGDARVIPHLLSMITAAALEILRLECESKKHQKQCAAVIQGWHAEHKKLGA
jgi:hypothetical protein